MPRCSHALGVDGRVWIVDAFADEEALDRAAGLGPTDGRPEQLLVGHGERLHDDVPATMRDAVERSRSRIGPWLWAGLRAYGPGGTHPLRHRR
jgi:hypothetical protein